MTVRQLKAGDRVIVDAKALRPLLPKGASLKDQTRVLSDTYKIRRIGKHRVQVKGQNGKKILRVNKESVVQLQASASMADFF